MLLKSNQISKIKEKETRIENQVKRLTEQWKTHIQKAEDTYWKLAFKKANLAIAKKAIQRKEKLNVVYVVGFPVANNMLEVLNNLEIYKPNGKIKSITDKRTLSKNLQPDMYVAFFTFESKGGHKDRISKMKFIRLFKAEDYLQTIGGY